MTDIVHRPASRAPAVSTPASLHGAPRLASSWAYRAKTTHARLGAHARRFSYDLFYLFLDIDAVESARTRFFSYNRANLFAFFDKDHGERTGAPLRPWCEKAFAQAGAEVKGAIRLLCLPRILGFVFNPLSIYFGYDLSGALCAILYEVNNTFGETHAYAFAINARQKLDDHRTPKRFHVSPFFDVEGLYRFTVRAPGERVSLVVDNLIEGVVRHRATLTGRAVRLSDGELIGAFFALPFMTLGVVAAIHWQALKIWLSGVRYRPKPPAPDLGVL